MSQTQLRIPTHSFRDKTQVNKTLRVLGRHILDIQREKSKATFTIKIYPPDETLRKLALSALGETHLPEVLGILKEASRRDTGVKHLVNVILSDLNRRAQAAEELKKAIEEGEALKGMKSDEDLQKQMVDFVAETLGMDQEMAQERLAEAKVRAQKQAQTEATPA